jgi:hypothetical protein
LEARSFEDVRRASFVSGIGGTAYKTLQSDSNAAV